MNPVSIVCRRMVCGLDTVSALSAVRVVRQMVVMSKPFATGGHVGTSAALRGLPRAQD